MFFRRENKFFFITLVFLSKFLKLTCSRTDTRQALLFMSRKNEFNVVLSYFMARIYGVTGVCFTTGVIFIMRTIALNVVYRKIRNDIINPGGFKDLELVLTWDLDEKKTNTINSVIEISETYNKSETRDIDSTAKNKEINEDDIDYSTSEIELEKKVDRTYILIIAGVILLILIAIFFIRKIVIVK